MGHVKISSRAPLVLQPTPPPVISWEDEWSTTHPSTQQATVAERHH